MKVKLLRQVLVRRKVVYLTAGISRRWGYCGPQKPTFISGQASDSYRELVGIWEGETSQADCRHAVSLKRRRQEKGEWGEGKSHSSGSGSLPLFRCYLSICFSLLSVVLLPAVAFLLSPDTCGLLPASAFLATAIRTGQR